LTFFLGNRKENEHQVLFRANEKNKIVMCKTNLKVIKNDWIFFLQSSAQQAVWQKWQVIWSIKI